MTVLTDRWYQEEAVDALFEYYSTPRAINENGIPEQKNAVVALPTGTGKSVVIAKFLYRAFKTFPTTRAIMSTHVKELIKQNAKKLIESWPTAPLGIYSAGLKSREASLPIVFGGIKSMVGKYPIFGYRDFLVIDEAHLVGTDGDTAYLKYIGELMYGPDYDPSKSVTRQQFERAVANPNCNPFLKVIMLTATPYRLGLGLLTNGPIATKIVYDLTDIKGFNRLIAEGFLAPLIPAPVRTKLDVSEVKMNGGEYAQGQLQNAVDKTEITVAALRETLHFARERQSGLIFASGVEHAEHIGEILSGMFGESCVVIHSKKSDVENEAALEAWKNGVVKWAVNMNALTTGVDHPACDVIVCLRPTMSTGLWVQMLGRGTRPFPGKANCMVLDFAGNTRRLGPINDPVIPKPKGKGPPGDAPIKVCGFCGATCHASARVCEWCGAEFKIDPGIGRHAGTDPLLRSDLPEIEPFEVERMICAPHVTKATKLANPGVPEANLPFIIRVAYYCKPMRTFYQYVTVEGGKFPAKKGRNWFRQVAPYEPPETNAEVLQFISTMRPPRRINVWLNANPSPEVMGLEF